MKKFRINSQVSNSLRAKDISNEVYFGVDECSDGSIIFTSCKDTAEAYIVRGLTSNINYNYIYFYFPEKAYKTEDKIEKLIHTIEDYLKIPHSDFMLASRPSWKPLTMGHGKLVGIRISQFWLERSFTIHIFLNFLRVGLFWDGRAKFNSIPMKKTKLMKKLLDIERKKTVQYMDYSRLVRNTYESYVQSLSALKFLKYNRFMFKNVKVGDRRFINGYDLRALFLKYSRSLRWCNSLPKFKAMFKKRYSGYMTKVAEELYYNPMSDNKDSINTFFKLVRKHEKLQHIK